MLASPARGLHDEATCKSLVTVRMKRPGARWKHTTGDEVMQLRALQLSDRWGSASSASRSSAMPPALGELASTMKRDETPCNATRTG